ncbi:hypothetical protein GCM10009759_48770 [Kitasatospora saccharophila]|uniref:Uncharacterized protein n=1 Tax=Kitasatospora saccharophila TaxID=407973 RepID=A0ABP5IY50_9ACTN
MALRVLVDQVGEVAVARYLVAGRKAELVEQDCSSSATLRDDWTLLPGRRVRPEGSAPVFRSSHRRSDVRGDRIEPYGSPEVTRR